jgi:hypothetical protein
LQVDLGGCCGDASWFRFAADAMGWVDAYVERMLMSVILVKDEVEQSRFMHSPFKMLSSAEAAGEEAGLAALSMPSSPRAKGLAELQQHSGKMSTRLARMRSSSAMGTPRGAAAALAAAELGPSNRSGSGRWYSVDSPTAGAAGTPRATLSGVMDFEDGPQVGGRVHGRACLRRLLCESGLWIPCLPPMACTGAHSCFCSSSIGRHSLCSALLGLCALPPHQLGTTPGRHTCTT